MAYDAHAKMVATKAIGEVESNLNYGAINFNDPITVGMGQWYGTRAAGILQRMKTENPAAWVSVRESIDADLGIVASNDAGFWNERLLNLAEGNSLKPVLLANKAIQNDQMRIDLDAYKATAVRYGMDAENNTNGMLFFFVMYHQTPRRARDILARYGVDSSLDRLLSGALNDPVFGQYKTRYNTAATIIRTGDTTGVDDTPGTPTPTDPQDDLGDTSTDSPTRPTGNVVHVALRGDLLTVKYKGGQELICYPNGTGFWFPTRDQAVGVEIPPKESLPEPEPDPNDPEPPPTGAAAKMAKWMVDRTGDFGYTWDVRRENPDRTGYADCSSLVRHVYRLYTDVELGGYTEAQYDQGTRILSGPPSAMNENLLQVGDLIYTLRTTNTTRNYADHVEMYIGNGQTSGHGGVPFYGPNVKTVSQLMLNKRLIHVQRHL